MGLDTEYSAGSVCQLADCQNEASWIVHVQWTEADFIDVECCDDDLDFVMGAWHRRTVGGPTPLVTAGVILRW